MINNSFNVKRSLTLMVAIASPVITSVVVVWVAD